MNNWTQFDLKKGLVHHSDGRPPLCIEIDGFGNAHLYLVRTSTSEQHAEDQALVLKSRLKKNLYSLKCLFYVVNLHQNQLSQKNYIRS